MLKTLLLSLQTRTASLLCKHEFRLQDLEDAKQEPLPKPTTRGYKEWSEYLTELYKHDSVLKRVKWPCWKCGKVFYAHCGLDIVPKHGRIVQDGN